MLNTCVYMTCMYIILIALILYIFLFNEYVCSLINLLTFCKFCVIINVVLKTVLFVEVQKINY